jgi:hypothetical protein
VLIRPEPGPAVARLFMAKFNNAIGSAALTLAALALVTLSRFHTAVVPTLLDETDISPDPTRNGGDGDGARWARYHADLKPFKAFNADSTYDQPLSSRFSTRINPYSDMPFTTRRGLPEIEARYEVPYARRAYDRVGSTPIFSADQASRDLDALHEFDLVKKKSYRAKRRDIKEAESHPFGAATMFPTDSQDASFNLDDPKSWTGETKMCRDVTTHVNGLDNEGWADLATLKCCSYLCSKSQHLAFRDGNLLWGFGERNRYNSAVPTDGPARMADGTERYLCRTCAWDKEPSWAQLGRDKLPKMEGHISTAEPDDDA